MPRFKSIKISLSMQETSPRRTSEVAIRGLIGATAVGFRAFTEDAIANPTAHTMIPTLFGLMDPAHRFTVVSAAEHALQQYTRYPCPPDMVKRRQEMLGRARFILESDSVFNRQGDRLLLDFRNEDMLRDHAEKIDELINSQLEVMNPIASFRRFMNQTAIPGYNPKNPALPRPIKIGPTYADPRMVTGYILIASLPNELKRRADRGDVEALKKIRPRSRKSARAESLPNAISLEESGIWKFPVPDVSVGPADSLREKAAA